MRLKQVVSLAFAVLAVGASVATVRAASLPDGMQGMNWASNNIVTTNWPDGLNASQTYGQQYAVGQIIGQQVQNAGGKCVRMPISTFLATGINWYLYAGAINGICSTGCKVDLCYWLTSGSTVSNVSSWYAMWDTVNASFGTNTYVHYEPVNEPTYSTQADLNNLYAGFIARYKPAAWKCILDGNNVATLCVALGDDSRLNNQYLGLHMYSWFASEPGPGGNGASWQGYYNECASCVGNYGWRTVISETGVQTDSRSPSVPFWQQYQFSLAPDQAALTGVLAWARDNNVATIAYSGINSGNLYHWFTAYGTWTEPNPDVNNMFRWSWQQKSSPVAAGNFRLVNRADGNCLDDLGATGNGANVCQWATSGSNNQVWNIIPVSSVWYKLQNVATGEYLDGLGSTTNGSAVSQWSGSGSYNQQWAFQADGTGSGYYQLINRATGQTVDTGGLTANGSVVQQWGAGSSYNQEWSLH